MDPHVNQDYVQWPKKIRVKGRQLVDLLVSQSLRKKYSFVRRKVFVNLTFYGVLACIVGYSVQYAVLATPMVHNKLIRDSYKERGW